MKSRIAAVAATVAMVITSSPAAAHAASAGSGGWLPTSEPNRVIPAGRACLFDMTADVVSQNEEYRLAASYPDGSPLEYQFRGPLVIDYTNTDNGKSVVRDLSGTAELFLAPDGTNYWVSQGNVALIIHPGDTYHAAGLFILTGPSFFIIHPDATNNSVQLVAQAGLEDLCTTLG